MDDFARRLVGPLARVRLPDPGAALVQGQRAWTLLADSSEVDMLSPVDGVVVDVNRELLRSGEAVARDPYRDGWLLKLRPTRLEADAKQLLTGETARGWMEGVTRSLRARMGPELGLLLQDGGQPVDGIARELDGERWAALARSFLLS
jgi:glycine cleavage system H protein